MSRQEFREEGEQVAASAGAISAREAALRELGYTEAGLAEAEVLAQRDAVENETRHETQVVAKREMSALDSYFARLPFGLAVGLALAAGLTLLAQRQNPFLLLGQHSATLLYAALGMLIGLPAVLGKRHASRAASGMAAAALVSPPLLILLGMFLDEYVGMPSMSVLVINAALPVGALAFLHRLSPGRAAMRGAALLFGIDIVYNAVTFGPDAVGTSGFWHAAWVSALHGAMLGGVLGILRAPVERGIDALTKLGARFDRPRPINPETASETSA